jgi:glycosyltransferase involved in cell wall biosynthesis
MSESPMLRVGLLADTVTGGGGMGRYAREVLRALARRSDVQLVVVVPAGSAPVVAELVGRRTDVVEIPIRGRSRVGHALWERYRLGRVLADAGVGVVHGVKHLVPRTRLPTVLTVHDLFPLTMPKQFGLVKRTLLPRQYLASMRAAARLVAVSGAVRARLHALDPRLAAKTVVAPNGFTQDLLRVPPVSLPELTGHPFALLVGDLSPRKNAGFVFDLWPDVYDATGGLQLAVVGPDGWRSRRTRRRLSELVAAGMAVRPGRVADGSLRWCYENTRVVLLPTLEEGFGLPTLEAAAFGAPVVANPDPALMEAGRGWPTFVDLDDREGWRHAIVVAAGSERTANDVAATAPTWDDHVRVLVDTYRAVTSPAATPVAS